MFIDILFILSAALTLLGAFFVAYSKNLIHACVYLLASLFGVAGLYATLGADFLAATQLVVYAGGVVILLLFAIMLTGGTVGLVNKFGINKVASMGTVKTYIMGLLSVVVISYVIMNIFANIMKSLTEKKISDFNSTVDQIGTMLITDHVLAFEISSILLLGALVGAAVISRPRKG